MDLKIKALDGVSKERILKELTGIMTSPYFMEKGFPLMMKTGIGNLIPGIGEMFDDMKSCFQNPDWHAEGADLTVYLWPKDRSSLAAMVSHIDPGYISHIEGGEFVKNYFENPVFSRDTSFEIVVNKCGNVFDHTILVLKEMENQIFDENKKPLFDEHDRFILMMSALLHDIGKPASARKNGKKSPELAWGKTKDHDVVGAPMAYDFCKALGLPNNDCEDIQWLVKHHMRAHQLDEMKSQCKIWKITSHPLFSKLILLARADEKGCRKTKSDQWGGIDLALEKPIVKETLGKEMPERILNGKHLIEKGFKPGPSFSKALDKAYEFQVNDHISDPEKLFKLVKGIVKGD